MMLFLCISYLSPCTHLNKHEGTKLSVDWLQLRVFSHQHVLYTRLAAVQGTVPGYMVTYTQRVLW